MESMSIQFPAQGSEPVVSLSAAVSDEQEGQRSDQKETQHCGPDDDGNNSLVIVGPTLHLWNRRQEEKEKQEGRRKWRTI